MRRTFIPILATLLWTTAARADDEPSSPPPTSYWHVSFMGGVLEPLSTTADDHELGLVAGGRVGWSHRSGLGLAIGGFYSPLPRKETDPVETHDSHFGVLTAGPQLSLQWKKLRIWMAAGAGMAYERTRHLVRNALVDKKSEYGSAGTASAGIELHFIDAGGLVVAADYARTFRSLAYATDHYQLATATAGLVFLFR